MANAGIATNAAGTKGQLTFGGAAVAEFDGSGIDPVALKNRIPAFSAYQSVAQSVPNNTLTKVQFQTEEFDTASCFDSTTNYQFTPNVAGYYQVSFCCGYVTSGGSAVTATLYKNGVRHKDAAIVTGYQTGSSALVYMNGTTDYVEVYTFQNSGGALNTSNVVNQTYFQGVLVRAA